MTPILQGRGLVKSYGPTPALRGVTLTVHEGEILAVTGPSGCGKSTLLHLLAGILRPDAGEVVYRDHRIDTWSQARRSQLRRGEFGVLFQYGQLVAELTAVENVALPLMLAGMRRRDAIAQAMPWFERLGLEGLHDRQPGEVSGGQSQRIALARALVTSPAVLFADEPTGSLDSLAGEQVMDLLSDVARAEGMTVVLVTHEARIAAYADREIIVRDGRCSVPVGAP